MKRSNLATLGVYALVPIWWVAWLIPGWGWLVSGLGGQDLAFMEWLVDIARSTSPWVYGEGWFVLRAAVALGVAAGLVGGLANAARATDPLLRAHGRNAAVLFALCVPGMLATPWVLGHVAGLDPSSFTVTDGLRMVGDNPLGSQVQRVSGVALITLLMALPAAGGVRANVAHARAGSPPQPVPRSAWIYEGVVLLLGVAMAIAATLNPWGG